MGLEMTDDTIDKYARFIAEKISLRACIAVVERYPAGAPFESLDHFALATACAERLDRQPANPEGAD